jgi:hypothetical protein
MMAHLDDWVALEVLPMGTLFPHLDGIVSILQCHGVFWSYQRLQIAPLT